MTEDSPEILPTQHAMGEDSPGDIIPLRFQAMRRATVRFLETGELPEDAELAKAMIRSHTVCNEAAPIHVRRQCEQDLCRGGWLRGVVACVCPVPHD